MTYWRVLLTALLLIANQAAGAEFSVGLEKIDSGSGFEYNVDLGGDKPGATTCSLTTPNGT
jgi:hypothetical protein